MLGAPRALPTAIAGRGSHLHHWHPPRPAMAGGGWATSAPLILTMMAWLPWVEFGGFIGMFSSQFDDDHRQI